MMSFKAAGRGDRQDFGASCPSVSMVPGASDHNTGDTRRRDPAWETAAITAAARKLARLVYSLLKHGTAYVAQEMAAYEAKYHERKLQGLTRQAQALGFVLVPASAGG
jgi:hypothetical protein